MSSKELKVKSGDLARPAFMDSGSSRGSEGVGIDDITIPRVDVLQALSPQRKKTNAEYIEGAEEGMLFNTVTKQLYGSNFVFVPVYFRKEYVIWKDRKEGGGFCGAFSSELDAINAIADQDLNPEIHQISDTGQHFGLLVDDHESENPKIEEAVISMSRSKMKVSRQLNTMIRMAGGDRFERAYTVAACESTNNNGEEFWNISVKQLGYVSESVFKAAEVVYTAITAGTTDVSRKAD
jgi:hypothetical protein|tara:strand:- start:1259 stop:1969 length:711 start_codon:yes stop_codon:yes gene_type:complete